MTFSQVAGTSIVPTLARLVLGIAFITLGWNRLTEQIEYPGTAAMRLQEMGVTVTATPKPAADRETTEADTGADDAAEPVSQGELSGLVVLASYVRPQDPESRTQPPPEEETVQDPPPSTPPATDDQPAADPEPEPAAPVVAEPDPNMTYSASRMHRITLALDRRGRGQYAKLISMGVALTEMIGGGLLLIGLFSRVWAFALAGAMGAALVFSSWPFIANVLDAGGPLSIAMEENMDQFNRLARHAGFLVLALLVMLAGPGPVSLDRLLFRREPAEPEEIEID